MKNIKDLIKEKVMPRRSFLKTAGLSSLGLSMGFPLKSKWAYAQEPQEKKAKANWKTNDDGYQYFVQDNILTNWLDDGYILARVDGWWWIYNINEYEDDFHAWWLEEKMWYYDQLLDYFTGETEDYNVPNGGHHHPMLATYGKKWFNRGDSLFHLNNTPKGYTLLPKGEYLRDLIDELNALYDDPNAKIPEDIFQFRKDKFAQEELWDKSKFATIEIYSGHPFDEDDWDLSFKETHTFQNVLENPMGTLTYMSLFRTTGEQTYFNGDEDETPTFEFRGICWMIDPHNPGITQYEKDAADYINQAFSKYHGLRDDYIINLFVMTEEFNNSPTDRDDYGLGKRVVPPFNYGSSNNMAVKSNPKKKRLTKEEKIELIKQLKIPL
ncbi:MAG: hypothetical protein KAR43_04295 [Deltaproteobacteria bacterium]|nr:hypothetical protein [Deltaproteobacteria bacterium]